MRKGTSPKVVYSREEEVREADLWFLKPVSSTDLRLITSSEELETVTASPMKAWASGSTTLLLERSADTTETPFE